MKDQELVSKIKSLQHIFAVSAGQKGTDGRDHYEGQATELEAVVTDIGKQDYFSAQIKLDGVRSHFRGAAYRLEYAIEKEGMFSDKKSGMKREAEELQRQEREVHGILYYLERSAKEHAEKHAADNTDTLMAAAENLKRSMTYDNRYSAPGEIADFLILATKNQQRQEKLLEAHEKREQEMSQKIDALEKRLAELEGPNVLDKPKIRSSGSGMRP